ncbi:hypothetical protein A3H89_04585 [Candidatus Amesbacteria bacterium RIFCSPLOWO2_02_FULL_48_11]|uniref:Peptide deformylase n=1 Tax=Candidatus Amesbacteria bacterium RIFCSPHIGHO2_12_FULL_48_14 TaxID=1797257 RepID=A0A1F4Z8D1_9BACT|nr:MAG: hypothetical protein A2V48_02380 [Candidatus Amesbacteria bacterium RBG_19FT_COMBO_48_16]OGC97271.1 MAG: hypothetical protein A3C34_04500 [Candidatus Amesbacteria bacterium RIFCSPHIGHO2_02_FULL_48_21]OGC99256.1 MAG: hypothetical protein A2W16_02560 [Candidatus Amesbacteria bacterium RBG_16_48_31]OGD00349.1 MAG: hypothetical protein A2702_00670 [Candidatus Amesbacteria bacterium RIFCSPHIGHO2_01_FULL_48_75]OGD02166.1 MAG: hypothetical protein A3E17_03590 [Candidatus Amesbacteria bacterium
MSPIVTVPHPVLRQVAKPVTRLDKKTLGIIRDMTATLLEAKNPEGVGLAAPQIGIPLRLFLIRPDPSLPPQVFINPEITKFSQRLQSPKKKKGVYEGCLSLPHHYAPITRSMSVTVKYQTIREQISSDGAGMPAKSRAIMPPEASARERVSTTFAHTEPKLITKTAVFSGFPAHIIQHEMDHLNGILFIDHVLSQNTKLFRVTGQNWEEIQI